MVTVHTSPAANPGAADAGGMNVVVWQTARALAAQGIAVDLLTRRDSPELEYCQQLAPGLRLFNLPAGPPEQVAKSDAESLIAPFTAELSKWWVANGEGISVIHSHHWFSGMAAIPVAHGAQVAHLQSYHSVSAPEGAALSAGEPPESPGRIPGERYIGLNSNAVLAVSEAEKRTIMERYQVPEQKIFVSNPGVDLERFRPLAPDEKIWAWGGQYLLFAARLQPLKAPDLALRALAEIPAAERPRLVIAGQTSKDFAGYADELNNLVTELGLVDRVLFLGSQDRDELAKMMRGALALVNPSQSETYGLINLEASASGIPVIATKTGGMNESVQDGLTGKLIDSTDPKQWAKAIQEIAVDQAKRKAYGLAGRSFAMGRSWAQVAKEWANCYAEISSSEQH